MFGLRWDVLRYRYKIYITTRICGKCMDVCVGIDIYVVLVAWMLKVVKERRR